MRKMNKDSESERPQIAKMPTGIAGFDEIARGGLPRERTALLVGGPGTGKTVFALQTLANGARRWGESGIFVAFEENSRQIIANAASFGWDLASLEPDKVFFLDARLSADTVKAGAFDLQAMLAGLQAKAQAMKAKRIVFDSIDVLLAMLEDVLAQRQELYRVHDWLQQSGLTGMLTARTDSTEAIRGRMGFCSSWPTVRSYCRIKLWIASPCARSAF
jgi:circadian clock protein KaiC